MHMVDEECNVVRFCGSSLTLSIALFMSRATMKLRKKKGTYLVPTITARHDCGSACDGAGLIILKSVAEKARDRAQNSNTFRAYKSGVKNCFWYRCGSILHTGDNIGEFVYIEGRMPIPKIYNNAVFMGSRITWADRIGGKMPISSAVSGDPLEDISG